MMLPSLLQFGPATPMDNDPFTIDATDWLAGVQSSVPDTLTGAACTVTKLDDSPQSSVSVTAGPSVSVNLVTVWLSGGVPNTAYLVKFHLTTQLGRSDWKSVGLYIVPDRS